MKVLDVRNVNEALAKGLEFIEREGELIPSRNGPTLEVPYPVATVYHRPWERVLLSKVRDANPFFHLMESIWILAGRYDVAFLNEFNSQMKEYSDDGLEFNAPYGFRMRVAVNMQIVPQPFDQLAKVISILKNDRMSRQAVVQIWDSEDLDKKTKDKACNMSLVFRIRNGHLCLTVYNRSNDMIWGAYGANAVQFSMIQEYVAAHLGLPLGSYTQITNSYHVYLGGKPGDLFRNLLEEYDYHPDYYTKMVHSSVYMDQYDMDSGDFQYDMDLLFNTYDEFGLAEVGHTDCWRSTYFNDLVIPMLSLFVLHKSQGAKSALQYVNSVKADDWKLAAIQWLTKRIKT